MLNRRELLALGACSVASTAFSSNRKADYVTPQQFGARAIGERFDDRPAIQRAIDFAWKTSKVSAVKFPRVDAFYNVRYPIVCRPGVSLVGDRARIKNLNDEGFLERSVFLPGNFHPDFTEKLEFFEIFPTETPRAFRLASEKYGHRFKPGSQVFITSHEYDFTGQFKVPEFGWLNQITSSHKGILTVEIAIDVEKESYKVAVLGSPARDDIPLFYHSNAELKGFDIETAGHWISDSACFNVRITENTVKSKTAIYGNTYQNCQWLNNNFVARNGFSEQSHNSLNTLALGNQFRRIAADDEPFVGFSFQEFARNIRFKDNVAVVDDCTGKRGPMVWFLNAAGVNISNLQVSIGSYGATTLVGFGRRDASATFKQQMNILSDSSFYAGTCGRYVEANGFNSPFVLDNRIERCSFDSKKLAAEAMRFIDNLSAFQLIGTKWSGPITVRGVAPQIS